ncbi:MAG: nucleoside monophosphate kinase [bacterium]|nr:nucleoside monophosphate kinase [bacterium]
MKKKKQFVILLIGPSGSGKGTQAQFLRRALGRGTHYAQPGYLLRKFVKRDSEAARRIQAIMRRGDLVPGFVAAYIWKGIILKNVKQGESIIFDGAARTFREAEEMDEVLRFIGFPLPLAVYITITPEETMRRLLSRGRFDDTGAAIVKRLRFFKKDVMPVITYYKKHKRLITVNGNQPVADVWADIKKALRL